MPAPDMRGMIDHEYKISKLNVIFALCCVFILIVTVWMILHDHFRSWQVVQRRFFKIERKKLSGELDQAKQALDQQRLETLSQAKKEAEKALAEHHRDASVLTQQLEEAEGDLYRIDQEFKFTKSIYDAEKYKYEEALAGGHRQEAEKIQRKLVRLEKKMADKKRAVEQIKELKEATRNQLKGLYAKRDEIDKEVATVTEEVDRIKKRLSTLAPTLPNIVRNMPMLDFIDPTVKIQQLVIHEIRDDYHFTEVPKVDRCVTCHLTIDKKGYEEYPQPYKTHPNLDLFLSSASPHPINDYGCTVCHGGSGHAIDFNRAVHTPSSELEAQDWRKKYGWEREKHWEYPQLPTEFLEAACLKCHRQTVEVPQAPKLNAGLKLIEEQGCFGCHTIAGFEGLRKVGPVLRAISVKFDKKWAYKWIRKPHSYNPSSKMPQFFDLSNTSTPEDLTRSHVEVHALVEFIFNSAEKLALRSNPLPGNMKRGKELIGSIGCLACHTIAGFEDKGVRFGPELKNPGSKLSREWLVDWLADPKHYWKETKMPSLRLTPQESSDIAAYLLSLRDTEFDNLPISSFSDTELDLVTLDYMKKKMTEREALEKLKIWSSQEKLVWLGERLVSRYGCFGCHDIKGFEQTRPIGVELTEIGEKPIVRLDYGFEAIPHTREAWLLHKLKNPRSFDRGRRKDPQDKLIMPNFHFTDEQVQAIVTVLLGNVRDHYPAHVKRVFSPAESEIEEGRRIIRNVNCRGCHIVEEKGGDIRAFYEDEGLAPPNLIGEGKKVQSDWLFNFFHEVKKLRPWLKVRMPTFGFSDAEASKLVRYFALLDKEDSLFEYIHERPKDVAAGQALFNQLKCLQCHKVVVGGALLAADLAPDLSLARGRLKKSWIAEWLHDPQALLPGTRMPTYFPEGYSPLPGILGGDAERQIQALTDYVWMLGKSKVVAE